jgi:hypothetical protein
VASHIGIDLTGFPIESSADFSENVSLVTESKAFRPILGIPLL